MILPTGWVYWVAAGDLKLGPAGTAPAGARTWPAQAVLVSAEATRTFLGEAVSAGLSQAIADQVLRERGVSASAS